MSGREADAVDGVTSPGDVCFPVTSHANGNFKQLTGKRHFWEIHEEMYRILSLRESREPGFEIRRCRRPSRLERTQIASALHGDCTELTNVPLGPLRCIWLAVGCSRGIERGPMSALRRIEESEPPSAFVRLPGADVICRLRRRLLAVVLLLAVSRDEIIGAFPRHQVSPSALDCAIQKRFSFFLFCVAFPMLMFSVTRVPDMLPTNAFPIIWDCTFNSAYSFVIRVGRTQC